MTATPGPNGPDRSAAWWQRAARRPAVLWTIAVVNLFVGLEATGVVVYSAVTRPNPINVGVTLAEASAAPSRPTPPPQPPPAQTAPSEQAPAPVAIDIPDIGVRSNLVSLALDGTGMLNGPEDYGVAGWWTGGPTPGSTGAAVVVGHVDSYRGPAVFFKLPTLQPGNRIEVRRLDGSTVAFTVDAIRQFPKDSFPTEMVYGPTTRPELRLVTCGGIFDRRKKSYTDNVVVFAHEEPAAPVGGAS